MTQAVAIRTTLITLLALLMSSMMVCAQNDVTTFVGTLAVPDDESGPISMSTNVISAERNSDKSNTEKNQPATATPQARPGERVTNPDHLILNFDTNLGGAGVNGPNPTDIGYLGPGDMRTHLWNDHSNELIDNGITEHKLMAMKVAEVQKWHNHFHGVGGSPEYHLNDGEQYQLDTIVQQSAMPPSVAYVEKPVNRTIFSGAISTATIDYENSAYNDSEQSPQVYGQFEIVHEQAVIIDRSVHYAVETPMQSNILNQNLIQFAPTDNETFTGQ